MFVYRNHEISKPPAKLPASQEVWGVRSASQGLNLGTFGSQSFVDFHKRKIVGTHTHTLLLLGLTWKTKMPTFPKESWIFYSHLAGCVHSRPNSGWQVRLFWSSQSPHSMQGNIYLHFSTICLNIGYLAMVHLSVCVFENWNLTKDT